MVVSRPCTLSHDVYVLWLKLRLQGWRRRRRSIEAEDEVGMLAAAAADSRGLRRTHGGVYGARLPLLLQLRVLLTRRCAAVTFWWRGSEGSRRRVIMCAVLCWREGRVEVGRSDDSKATANDATASFACHLLLKPSKGSHTTTSRTHTSAQHGREVLRPLLEWWAPALVMLVRLCLETVT